MKKYHYREDWRDLDGYFTQLARTGSTVTIATFVGATQVRLAVIGKTDRRATTLELAHMVALVDSMMEQGALGLSSALEYAPAFYAPTEELTALARAASRHGGSYATHMRNEGGDIDTALRETFEVARDARIPVEIWHLKISGRLNWGRMPAVLARIDSARAAGLDVTADQYPYTAAATSLARPAAIDFIRNEPDVQAALKSPLVAMNTDAGGVAPDGPFGAEGTHPRAYGSATRILGHYVRDLKLIPLEFAVRKMTSLAAQRVGLTDRGLLKPGMAADITVFDPATVGDRATFDNPHQPSVGIAYVYVHGQRVLEPGKLTAARPGRGLRGPGYLPPR